MNNVLVDTNILVYSIDFEIMSICLENGISKIASMNKDDFKDVEEIELIEF